MACRSSEGLVDLLLRKKKGDVLRLEMDYESREIRCNAAPSNAELVHALFEDAGDEQLDVTSRTMAQAVLDADWGQETLDAMQVLIDVLEEGEHTVAGNLARQCSSPFDAKVAAFAFLCGEDHPSLLRKHHAGSYHDWLRYACSEMDDALEEWYSEFEFYLPPLPPETPEEDDEYEEEEASSFSASEESQEGEEISPALEAGEEAQPEEEGFTGDAFEMASYVDSNCGEFSA